MHLIVAAYRANDTIETVKFFNRHDKSIGPGRRILVLNDPSYQHLLQEFLGIWELVLGTNALGEFSAWQEGLDVLRPSNKPVVFANDTVITHRTFTIFRWLAVRRAMQQIIGPTVIGFTNTIGTSLLIDKMTFCRWVSTYLFVVSADALILLNYAIVEPHRVRSCVTGGLNEDCFFANMSNPLSAHLRKWLFLGWWYGGGPLTVVNQAVLTRKAEAIVAEKLLSASVYSFGITVVDPFHNYKTLNFLDQLTRRLLNSTIVRLAKRSINAIHRILPTHSS